MESRINTNRPIKKVKICRGIGKRHLRGPNCTNNSSPKRRGGDIRSFSSIETCKKILTTDQTKLNLKNPKLKHHGSNPKSSLANPFGKSSSSSSQSEIKMTTKIPNIQLNIPKATSSRNIPQFHSLTNRFRSAEKNTLSRTDILTNRPNTLSSKPSSFLQGTRTLSTTLKIISIQLRLHIRQSIQMTTPRDIESHNKNHTQRTALGNTTILHHGSPSPAASLNLRRT